jgi:Na+/proline symporter
MLWTALVIFYFSLERTGGLQPIFSAFKADPSGLDPFGNVGSISALSWFFVFAVGSLGQPHVIHKFMMVKNLKILRFFPLVLAVSMLICGLVWLGVGLSVKALTLKGELISIEDADQTIILFVNEFVPGWLGAIILIGVLAAIMSTVDSFVNVGSAALTRDLPKTFRFSFRKEVLWARIWTVVLFSGALFFSIRTNALIGFLGILSFGLFASALTPSLALGLNWSHVGRTPVRFSIVTGIASMVVFHGLKQAGVLPNQLSPELLALVLSFSIFLLISEFQNRKSS